MSEERVQKLLARAGVASRRGAEEMIREGRVTVNGRVVGLGDKADLEKDAVKLDGRRVVAPSGARRYLLMNKPKGVLTTREDPEGRPTVFDLLPPGLRRGLNAVGRLDFNTEGLLILTDDGELAQRVAHPRYGCTKTYEVKVKGTPDEAGIEALRQGIVLEGRRTAPAVVEPRPSGRRERPAESNSWWLVEIGEGRTRQVREMFFRIGHPVQKLRRVAIGGLRDPRLPLGGWRELAEQEVERLRHPRKRKISRPIAGTPGSSGPRRRRPAPAGPKGKGKGRPAPGKGSGGRP